MEERAQIAILRWEQGLVPKGLMQLEAMAGNSTNPSTFPFPVRLEEVPGACVETVITNPSKALLTNMIKISKRLVEEEGIRAISTSCGFNAIFQRELAEALPIPVFTSSLLQVPYVQNLIGRSKTVGVVTANKQSLTRQHFEECGITSDMHVKVFGLEQAREWSKIFNSPDEGVDLDTVEGEILNIVAEGVAKGPSIGAIVLECTDLPPFARKIRETVNLPVFDFVSMVEHAAMALGVIKLY